MVEGSGTAVMLRLLKYWLFAVLLSAIVKVEVLYAELSNVPEPL